MYCITACQFLLTLRKPLISVNMSKLSNNPYEYKYIRKSLDHCAFNMYGHWVKHGEEQSRAALFEAVPKCNVNSNGLVVQLNVQSPTQPRAQKMHKALNRTMSLVD